MATELTQSLIDQDPTIQAIARSGGAGTGRSDLQNQILSKQRMSAYLDSKGYTFPKGYGINQQGQLQKLPEGMNWWALLAPASVFGGVELAAGLAGSGAGGASAAGGASSGTNLGVDAAGVSATPGIDQAGVAALPPTGWTPGLGTLGAPVAASAGTAGAGSPATAAKGNSSLWQKIAVFGGIGASVAQGLISAHAANKAAEQQQQATMAALDLQKQIWQQQQANLAPYMQTGSGALNRLNGLTALRPASQVFGG